MGLEAPFPWFGGKRKVAGLVWERFGDVKNYVEPFFGSGAVLLGRPQPFDGAETVNDADGLIVNFWRAIKAAPDEVAEFADCPVFENDLHARHAWLVGQLEDLVPKLEGDPDYFDAKIAGVWVWGISCWIGAQFGSGTGPWAVRDGKLVRVGRGAGVVKRQRPHLHNCGMGVHAKSRRDLRSVFESLSVRFRFVRVCCGDWQRVCGPSATVANGRTAVFLDPPYSLETGRNANLYNLDGSDLSSAVRSWALEHGDDSRLRIAVCGYDGEHEVLESEGWEKVSWKANGGYGNQRRTGKQKNKFLERIWFSPNCVRRGEGSGQSSFLETR